jgi:hypothetical protein
MARRTFDPQGIAQRLGDLSKTRKSDGDELGLQLDLHWQSWQQLAKINVTLDPALFRQYAKVRDTLGQLAPYPRSPLVAPKRAYDKALNDLLWHSHKFLVALPDDPVVVPPRPKGGFALPDDPVVVPRRPKGTPL